MISTTELSLPLLPVETPRIRGQPDPYLEAAQRQHPWLARFSQGYVVYGYEAVTELLADETNLLSGFGPVIDFHGLRGTMWARFMEEIIMARSGSGHRRLRASIAHAFTPRQANGAREMMRRVMSDLLDEWAPKGSFDFADFASYYPVAVMCGLLGVSTARIAHIRTALENQLAALTLDPAMKPLFLAGWDVLWEFADTLVKEREACRDFDEDSLLDSLIATKNEGKIDEIELRFMLLTLVIGGYDTSKNQFSATMNLLVDRPNIYARCAEDLEYCARVVDEALRHTATVSPWCQAVRDFVYRDFEFRQGVTLVIATPLGGRDPAVFRDPSSFNPDRENANRHLGFGRGPHICLGQFIARNLLQEGLHLVTQRLKHPRVTGEIEWRSFLASWGLKHLPISFEAS